MSMERCRCRGGSRIAPGPSSPVRSQVHLEHGAIHTLSGLVKGETTVFASAPLGHGAKPWLTQRLLSALARLGPRWSAIEGNAFTLHKTPLGEPYLLLGGRQGPSLSFSRGGGRLWAALGSQWPVGIDVADPEDFTDGYPYERVFRPEELDVARAIGHGNTARAAALIWSLKEASVKAAGTGFNGHDPREVRVGSPRTNDCGMLFDVWAGGAVSAWARAEGLGWLAVASTQRRVDPCPCRRFPIKNNCA